MGVFCCFECVIAGLWSGGGTLMVPSMYADKRCKLLLLKLSLLSVWSLVVCSLIIEHESRRDLCTKIAALGNSLHVVS